MAKSIDDSSFDKEKKSNNSTTSSGQKGLRITSFKRFGFAFFLLGVCSTLLVMSIVIGVTKKGKLISDSKLKYYQSLDEEFGKYYEIKNVIDSKSLYKVNDGSLDDKLMDSVFSTVDDKYAKYYTKAEYDKFRRSYIDSYTGIGVATQKKENGDIEITRVLEDGTAKEAGLRSGDKIISIDGKKPKTLNEASKYIQGKSGTSVTIEVKRGKVTKKYTMDRAAVEDKSIEYKVYDAKAGIGYITISRFREGASSELKDAINSLKSDNCKKIIIDVRGNPGGVMKEGVKCADILLPECKIVTVKNGSKNGNKETVYNSDSSTANVKYAVLVDGETASAAEIFAGAIKDNKGGMIIGTKTYGKGVIQELVKLKSGGVLKLTVEEYFLPSGEAINEKGITPDVKTLETEKAVQAALAYLK